MMMLGSLSLGLVLELHSLGLGVGLLPPSLGLVLKLHSVRVDLGKTSLE